MLFDVIAVKPGDRVWHKDGWSGTVRKQWPFLDNSSVLVNRDDTQSIEWVWVEDLSDAPQQP